MDFDKTDKLGRQCDLCGSIDFLKLNSWPIYLIARLAIAFFRVIPRGAGAAVIRLLATVFYCLDAKHRYIAYVNLRIALCVSRNAAPAAQ